MEEAAEKHGVQLIVLDNECREDVALTNAQTFVHQGVDFVIEFQVNERVAPVIAHTFAEARIPCLWISSAPLTRSAKSAPAICLSPSS